jgi:quercetin dioxygenase-like cupin family protein
MSIWKSKTSEITKPWGTITQIITPFGMNGKIIHFEAGQRNSLKYYKHLSQCLYCLSGKAIIGAPNEFEFGDIINKDTGAVFELNPGDLILIQAGDPYRISAVEDSILVEVLLGSHSGEFIMLDDDYGRI